MGTFGTDRACDRGHRHRAVGRASTPAGRDEHALPVHPTVCVSHATRPSSSAPRVRRTELRTERTALGSTSVRQVSRGVGPSTSLRPCTRLIRWETGGDLDKNQAKRLPKVSKPYCLLPQSVTLRGTQAGVSLANGLQAGSFKMVWKN